MSKVTIEIGDNLELLKGYPDNHFDSVVTDAPYGLGKEPNAVKLLQDWIDHGYHEIKGKGFMGKNWDAFVPQPVFWKEVFRVLKPGGYLLCFFGTRTYDWGTMAIRLAGFEIRDMITWHYGSGFPKSLDVSKAIDKHLGAERKITRKAKSTNKAGNVIGFDNRSSQDREQRTEAATEAQGWGTALKPATEPICVARKPLEGTVAQNMIKHGTGGINIDACRIELSEGDDPRLGGKGVWNIQRQSSGNTVSLPAGEIGSSELGRFPSNLVLDPFMADEMDSQTGELTSGKPVGVRKASNNIYGHYETGHDITGFGDSGGASRFFYCAKASQFERSAGLSGLKVNDGMQSEIDNPFQRGETERTNFHPTVKPIALMRWLQRLVTPGGGLTLDPFAGSGTSGCSAHFEGFNIVLMEAETDYIPIIEARITYWGIKKNRDNYELEIRPKKIDPLPGNQTSLF